MRKVKIGEKMKIKILFILFTSVVYSSFSFACPKSNSSMQVVEGKKNGQKFCAIRSTDATKPAKILKSTTFYSDTQYVLGSGVYVGKNKITLDESKKIKLTIEPGTRILGQSQKAYLQINRGAMIIARGTQEKPIVFTPARPKDRVRGSWGGLVINGNAPVNGCDDDVEVCELKGEGLTNYKYGGPKSDDSSGVLNYVVVEFAGYPIANGNELNGIAFQGVGSKTQADFIQVHMNADDGVEFFGGTVNVKHLVLTGNEDDSLDWTNGWTGSAQFVLIEQYSDAANNGIEADNFSDRNDASPRSNPFLANMTLIGTDKGEGAKGGSALLLREGTAATVVNTYLTGFSDACIDIDNNETFKVGEEGSLVFKNIFSNCKTPYRDNEKGDPWKVSDFVQSQEGNKVFDLGLNGVVPTVGSNTVESVILPEGLVSTDYVGAFKDEADLWNAKWTVNSKK